MMQSEADFKRQLDLALALADRNTLRDGLLRLRDRMNANERIDHDLRALIAFAEAMQGGKSADDLLEKSP